VDHAGAGGPHDVCDGGVQHMQVNAVHGGVKVQCVSLGDVVVDGQVLRLLLEVG